MDILLLADMGGFDGRRLHEAIRSTFLARNTHPMPLQMPAPPKNWERPFRRMANEIRLEHTSLEEANTAMERFLNPALRNEVIGVWDPIRWDWV